MTIILNYVIIYAVVLTQQCQERFQTLFRAGAREGLGTRLVLVDPTHKWESPSAMKMAAHLSSFVACVGLVLATLSSTPSCYGSVLSYGLGNITQTQAYAAGEGGYYCFRIPALLFNIKGTLLAFAEGRGKHTGSCDDHGDVHIVVKRSSDLGQTWSNLTIVHMESGHTIGKDYNYV